MLRDLYPRHHRQYEGSRCGAELEAFASWLEEQGHLRHPLRLHLYRARQALDHSDRFQSGSVFKEDDVREAFVVSGTDTYLYLCTGRIFLRFLAATGRLVPVETVDANALLCSRYRRYLAEGRGLSSQTLKHHGSTVADFCRAECRPSAACRDSRP